MRRRAADAGFSLAEVVVALGLLAGVIISVAGMFVLGNRQVNSGRRGSEALSVARHIMEEMNSWGFRQVYGHFASDCTPSDTVCSVVFDEAVASTETTAWRDRLATTMGRGRVEVLLEPVGDGTPTFETAPAVRVSVTVSWTDGARQRRVRLANVRT